MKTPLSYRNSESKAVGKQVVQSMLTEWVGVVFGVLCIKTAYGPQTVRRDAL
jgi:hypothetical protein